jgi:glutamate carboxypeptidase
MSVAEAIQRYVGENTGLLLEQLREVVDVNSGTGNVAGNEAMLTWFEAAFRASGLDRGGRVAGTGGRPHLVLQGGGGGEGSPHVLLVGHVDTVFAPDHPFQRFELRGDRAHGPGVSDMKGGLLIAAHTLRALSAAGALDRLRVTAFVNSDEEIQSPTSKQLLVELCARERFDMALVFEGGRKNGNLVSARKGVGRYVFTTHGRAAHAGMNHEAGVNAILEMASKVLAIQGLTDYARGVTVNVGLISGGLNRNTVPPEARCEVDVRVRQPEDGERVDRELRAIAASTHLEGATTTVEGRIGRPPWPRNEGSDRLVAHWQAAGRLVGQAVEAEATGGGSDGNFTHELGIPTLDALGAKGGAPHTADEYIEIASLAERVALHAMALATLQGVADTHNPSK